jgi:hypothetical protein
MFLVRWEEIGGNGTGYRSQWEVEVAISVTSSDDDDHRGGAFADFIGETAMLYCANRGRHFLRPSSEINLTGCYDWLDPRSYGHPPMIFES